MDQTPILSTLRPPSGALSANAAPVDHAKLRETAKELETVFLSEMLKHARIGAPRESFGGGQGEAQFASMLRMEYARSLAARGGIGLAEQIYQDLLEQHRTTK